MKIDKRVEKSTKSLKSLVAFIQEIVNDPTPFAKDERLRKMLRSQGSLAKFSDDSLGICSTSLNTVKRQADASFEGGFAHLNRLRLTALSALASVERVAESGNKRTKAGLEQEVGRLERSEQQLYQDLLRLSDAFQKSLRHGRNYAEEANDPVVLQRCIREQKELLAEVSLMSTPRSNVIPFNRG
jgi:hypothetical protein